LLYLIFLCLKFKINEVDMTLPVTTKYSLYLFQSLLYFKYSKSGCWRSVLPSKMQQC